MTFLVMASDAARQGRRAPGDDLRVLRAFVSNEGLAALHRLEAKGGECRTHGALKKFRSLAQNWSNRDLWYGVHDTMWLPPFGPLTNTDTTAVLDKYPESESGPRDAWLHTLLQVHADDELFDAGSRSCFRCDKHATQWGYAFWDRDRLSAIAGVALPTTEEMVDVGISMMGVQTDEMLFYSKFRKEKGCTCRRH